MHQTNFIVREPLLDPKQRVIGYELSWQRHDSKLVTTEELEDLIGFVAEHVVHAEHGWLLRDKMLFLEAVPEMLSTDALHALPPERTVLTLNIRRLTDPNVRSAVQAVRVGGVGISIRGADINLLGRNLSPYASYVEVQFAGADVATQARTYAAAKHAAMRMVGRPVATWADFDACAALGLDAFVGKLHLTPRPGNPVKGMNPTQAVILQLMQMVQNNEDVPKIENVLKRDPALTYKLLRFINSAGFGAAREVQSLRQAIALMGYAPLYRWLVLLLATASASGYSPVLMETAVVRGRLAELLGASALRGEGENLFVCGMFSLLDRLLGLPMAEVLETVPLPEEVVRALIGREGRYGPYLALAEACELNSNLVASLAASLDISPLDVNRAHLSALAWAQSVAG
ncbi:EAL and HDOD domain-containing protein [Massilia yuzhufengensis]|uniref:EAL and modified HD-GYP domain-containing signal transduction protein n=1 Tax=Massilia yuzhufengensis TaxID=1164594 RepID=A0A1I1SQ46_9BURK|nr:HDOD domain-containing protein [Massilia yuzhufengensis]SFD45170.1 EAL and modified HD-GYP domain-containing signal transduction protein [Massilia yuzhufengensis]